jgi:hypothetical protein
LRFSFLGKSKLVAREQGRCAQKASAQLFRIADFGFRIFWIFFFNPHSAIGIPQFGGGPIGRAKFGIRNVEFGILTSFFSIPHSAIRIPHLNCPPGPGNEVRLMVFARNALAPGPGNAWHSIHLIPTWRKVREQGRRGNLEGTKILDKRAELG